MRGNPTVIAALNKALKEEGIDVGASPKDLVYEQDKLKLWHYRPMGEVTCKVPVLIVYALVNREYMLDLQPDRSLVRNLLQKGMDLYIIEWGYPTRADMYLSLDDYINGYLNDCVDFVRESTANETISLMGICQGGTFATIYSAIYPERVKNLVTLVAPFDFSTNDGLLFRWAKHMNVSDTLDAYRIVPEINDQFPNTDVALVVGANDVVNPDARNPDSIIAGMPILDVDKACTVMVVKRSMAAGYAGLDNELFYMDKTMMVFGDAKKVVEDMVKAL